MRNFNKKLVGTAAAAALMAAIGASWAQSATIDPNDTPMTSADTATGAHILNFKDQGNSPETDPAAHLLLIKDAPAPMPAPVATTTVDNTQVAAATPVDTTPMPAANDTSTVDTTTTDTSTAPADTAPMPAPRADRN